MSSSRQKPDPVLNRSQAETVLRYWLAALRLEEALQVRPTARPATGGAIVPLLHEPVPGQEYFKVPLGAPLADLLSKQTELRRPFDAELCAFFESWLYAQYRRGEHETELSHLLCFPVVHLPNGELAGLLRASVRLRFGSENSPPFQAPQRAERLRGAYPLPPTEARLTRTSEPNGGWPFFIDTRLLHRTLAVPTESIDALFEALRTLGSVSEPQLLALVTILLESVPREGENERKLEPSAAQAEQLKSAAESTESTEAWLTRLTSAVKVRLAQGAPRARVYPIGIVVDGTRARTTWHLQRELESLERDGWKVASPLGAYVTGKPLPAAHVPQRALFPGPALTGSQRATAEAFWGSELSAAQGPPGTGKTRLILHICAEAVVRQAEVILGARKSSGPLLVTSSLGRAVDNVIEPLTAMAGLPLALRGGSRQACEQKLAPQLRQAIFWLKRAEGAPAETRNLHLEQAKRRFRELREASERTATPRRLAAAWAKTRADLERELAACGTSSEGPELGVTAARARVAFLTVGPLERRLEALSALCEAAPSIPVLKAIESHYRRTEKRQLRALCQALEGTALALDVPFPPPVSTANLSERLEAWEEASELALAKLAEIRAALDRTMTTVKSAERSRRLRAQLDTLNREPPPAMHVEQAPDEEARELFTAAIRLREAWASVNAHELLPAVSAALRAVEQDRSLRAFFRDEAPAAQLVSKLFGIWGCTLLSLGNCFPGNVEARVIIDEAGQCHPAHAVSALLRAQAALVLGDVHQLSPVIELGTDDEMRLVRRSGLDPRYLRPYRVHESANTSTQSLADRAVDVRGRLTDHFRCQREIIAISDALCGYGLTVHTPRANRSGSAVYLERPVSLVDLRGQQARAGGSWYNQLELDETLSLVESLLAHGVQLEELAVITPYRGQLEQLRRSLAARQIPLESSPELETDRAHPPSSGLALGTVHRFQGGERSIVLFSSVVTHSTSLGFLNERPNLLNVAVSRAQHHFVCLGHAEVLSRGLRSRLLVDGVARLSTDAYRSIATVGRRDSLVRLRG